MLKYIRALYETVRPPQIRESAHIQKMKKYLNYIGLGIEPTGHSCTTSAASRPKRISSSCAKIIFCHDRPMPLEPFALDLKETDVMAGEHL